MEKEVFVYLVQETIKTHPDWWYDLIAAIQSGIIAAIEKQSSDKAALAYSMSGMLGCIKKMPEKKRVQLSNGLEVLADFFASAAIGQDIRELIPSRKMENKK